MAKKAKQELAVPQQDERAAIIQVIERAAANPNVDLDKMERLLQMQERIMDRQAKADYIAALARLQPKLPVIGERGKIKNNSGGIQSTYALWEDINEALRPALAEEGFSLSFRFGAEGDNVTVTGVLSHQAGHSEQTIITLPVDKSGSKNAVQAVASSTSYGKRYTAGALLNFTSRGEDDDAQVAGAAPITEEQAKVLNDLIVETDADKQAYLRYLSKGAKRQLSGIEDIPAKIFKDAKAALEAKKKAVANG